MLNNFCEDESLSDAILRFHEKTLETMEIPEWMNVKCPFCGKELPLRSIRSVSLKLNSRNLGDLALEIFCPSCSKMDTVYFRKEVNNIKEFSSFLNGGNIPKSDSIVEEEMYRLRYNNLMDKMVEDTTQTKTEK